MAKRYEEPADVEAPDGSVEVFWWRGRRYRVLAVVSRWREAGGWWEAAADTAQPWARGESREIWRVDARPEPLEELITVSAEAPQAYGTRDKTSKIVKKNETKQRHPAGRKLRRLPAGTYELCRDLRNGSWSLFRVWD
ncbi:MAG: hypothetical protein NVSMB57_03230 [Actinomycetota bacterium]